MSCGVGRLITGEPPILSCTVPGLRAGFYLDGPALIFGQNVGQDGEPFIGPAQAVNEADHRLLGEAHSGRELRPMERW